MPNMAVATSVATLRSRRQNEPAMSGGKIAPEAKNNKLALRRGG
jgi:hypothetical protein